jgi:phosphoribosylaminoimidazole (AIR) synthetase
MGEGLSCLATGVDIDSTDEAKRRMAKVVDSGDPRVFNKLGAFASLVEGAFPQFAEPVLVLKTDEPGSKQKLAFELDRVEGLCRDLVNHLLNDVAVMGAHPLYVLDCIVCGVLDADVVGRLVAGMAAACKAQEAVLVGGETFLDVVMRPHTCYYLATRGLFGRPGLHGLAHITGGGLRDNVVRILPPSVDARIDLSALRVPEVFRVIREEGDVPTLDMLRTFNLGCGMIVVCAAGDADTAREHFVAQGHDCWKVGDVIDGTGEVLFDGEIAW